MRSNAEHWNERDERLPDIYLNVYSYRTKIVCFSTAVPVLALRLDQFP